jgi:Uma2 family endonuclease
MGTKVVLTYADYAALPDDGRRYELYEGEIEMTPAPTTRHQRALNRLNVLLYQYLQDRRAGEVFIAPTDLILSDVTVVQPDLLVVLNDRCHLITERGIEGPPDLVVEVLSAATASRDRGIKMQLYARYGVPHYWLVDLDTRTLEAYQLEESGYRVVETLRGSGSLTPPLFPGFSLSGSALWP